MKKLFYFVIVALVSTIFFTSCTSNKSISIAKEYVDEYYQNFGQQKSTQCYYQFNKNSSDILEAKYNIGVEDFLSSRARVLGPVVEYEILNEEYHKEGSDKFVDFDIRVKYQNAEVQESQQIVIKKDGQKSINEISFSEDNVIDTFILSYKTALIANDLATIKEKMSSNYYLTKTEKNLEATINQANIVGGKLWGGDIVKENYIFEPLNGAAYVYEVIIELKYENDIMQNKIKIIDDGEALGIGSIVILPDKLSSFLDNYTFNLSKGNKEETLGMYKESVFGGSQDRSDTQWNLIKSYTDAYGSIIDYNVVSFGNEDFESSDGNNYNGVRADVIFNYESNSIINKLTLIEIDGSYLISNQIIVDE